MRRTTEQSNIRPLNAAGKHHIAIEAQQAKYARYIHLRRRFLLGVFMIIVAVVAMVNFHKQYVKYTTTSAGLTETSKTLSTAKASHSDLKQEVKDLGDNSYLEKLVREKYMYTKNGETVFNIPN
ncbi:septum formation initiator family protein [Weissella paramesenteroides]|jgi:cell division protein DivIC|uniref:Septum formation initiator family protein n=2 Tax=Weissella paramesenteroides TaxID=1249 RepID=A0ABD4XK63_WEIPA|nr:septum formation initiator family protein [Weissella paramesenteroides]KAA8440376.1 septum formation initiator family protein [Weissella paramesenteroides]KAA8440656.1 septum formation initiator family protein [Weissella paramesenteroides]KAA8440751.1 septum formation initiator family protein [Weissella paramesenteroides]KAA8445635.1 septum formation initiator family protein [Weissella paramesenteroides]KAA8447795.1 septum formation initiator family protein [Weissella paramesenteroides]